MLALATADMTKALPFAAPLLMRAAQRMRVTQPMPTAHTAPPAMMKSLPSAESMLTHVLLPAAATAAPATERVVRDSRPAGRAQPAQPGATPLEPAHSYRRAAPTAGPVSSDESAAPTPDMTAHETHIVREFPVLSWLRPNRRWSLPLLSDP